MTGFDQVYALNTWIQVILISRYAKKNIDAGENSCLTDCSVIYYIYNNKKGEIIMTPLQKDPAKADAIIRAAIQIFARDGLDKGKIADIAIVAGIGKGTVYEYFNSKDAIFHAIVDTLMGDMVAASEKLYSMDLSPYDKLRTFIRMNTELVFEMGDAVLIMTEIWAQGARAIRRGEHQSTQLTAGYEQMRTLVVNILKAGVEAQEFREMNYTGVATLCLAFIDGFVWQFMLNDDMDAFNDALRDGIDSFMKGLKP